MNLCCFLKLMGNKTFFVCRIKGVSFDIGKLRRYFQSVKCFKFNFSGQEYDRCHTSFIILIVTVYLSPLIVIRSVIIRE